MEKPVILYIYGKQTDPDGHEDKIELVTHGTLKSNDDGVFHISYEESKVTGLEGTMTTFLIEGKQITMTRSGNLKSKMVFNEGEQHISLYETEAGTLTVGVDTHVADANMSLDGGTINLLYGVQIDDHSIGMNSLFIEIKLAESKPSTDEK